MTMSAVVTTYLAGLVYFAATGTYYFFDSYIPIAVFLGMHLLFTDPSTSPRTELGRIIFGMAYGLSTMLLYKLLSDAGLPTFYDKLLQVPLLNISIKAIDRAARSPLLRKLDPGALGRALTPRRRNLAAIAVWAVTFAIISAAKGIGDSHPGQWVLFWQQACNEDRPYSCDYLVRMQSRLCDDGSGWACNEFAILQTELTVDGPGPIASLEEGCRRSFSAACENLDRVNQGEALRRAVPALADYPFLLRGSKGPLPDLSPPALFARACRQGWVDACDRADRTGVR